MSLYHRHTNTENVLHLEDRTYSKSNLATLQSDALHKKETLSIYSDLQNFLEAWWSSEDTLNVKTSGSTGAPKMLTVRKESMLASARRTCAFLDLQQGDSALLCMPLQYIGAKMMVVRALVASLELHMAKPSLNPLQALDFSPNFVAMTPQQAALSLENPREANLLRGVHHLLLGGMAVPPVLEEILQDFPHAVWLSYGMTETLSHVALRRINGPKASPYFSPLTGVRLSISPQETLIIDDTTVCNAPLTTNDRAEMLLDGRFRILGRADNVVNSGGIKIQLEEVEAELAKALPVDFQLTAAPHATLGEQLVLLTESPCPQWKDFCLCLHKHKRPKAHILVSKLPLTPTGKADRAKARLLAEELCNKA